MSRKRFIEARRESETAHPVAASTRRHYLSRLGTRFLARVTAGDPTRLIAEPRTFRRQDKSISFGPRPSRRQNIIFALSSPAILSLVGVTIELMPRPSIVYEVLIASPSDVHAEREILAQVIEDWNSTHSRDRGVSLKALRWELDSVPGSGARPQEILNRQLVENADILIGVFWTRLGTPTGQAVSGTAEEINHFRGAGKPVLLYFSEADIPHDSDLEQLRRLKEYRKTLEIDTLYQTFYDVEELRRRVTRDLARTVNHLISAAVQEKAKPIATQNELAEVSIRTVTQYTNVGLASPLKVIQVFGTIENRSPVLRAAEYSCTLSVPTCCLTFNNAIQVAEIKSNEPGYRKFRYTEKNHTGVSIHPGDRFQVISVEIAVGHLSPEDQEKCGKMDLIADAIVYGRMFQVRKSVAELVGD